MNNSSNGMIIDLSVPSAVRARACTCSSCEMGNVARIHTNEPGKPGS